MKPLHMIAAAVVLAPLAALAAAAAGTGELWETQLQMRSASHGAMDMPPQRICQRASDNRDDPRTWMGPQAPGQCRTTDVQRSGDRVSWRMRCPDGEGGGEMRFVGGDRIEGSLRLKNAQGDFELQIRGRKLGACTPGREGS